MHQRFGENFSSIQQFIKGEEHETRLQFLEEQLEEIRLENKKLTEENTALKKELDEKDRKIKMLTVRLDART